MRSLFIILMLLSSISFAQEMPKFSGDIRYRVERTDREGQDVRLRHRIRGRIGLNGKVSESLSYGFRLASGDSDDPTSTNTTLDSSFSSKSIYFDRIYIEYKLLEQLQISAGKMNNPFVKVGKNHMLFDGDLSPEGLAFKFKQGLVFAQAAYFILEERSTGADTAFAGLQIGTNLELGMIKLKSGLGHYGFMALQGHKPLYDTAKAKGNTLANGNYRYDYDVSQLFVSANLKAWEFFGEYIINTCISENNSGWIVGVSHKGEHWVGFYNYRKLEKDATVGALVDSDFSGGGTDNHGHIFGIGYYFSKKSRLSLTHFINKTAASGGDNYQKTFLDYKLYF